MSDIIVFEDEVGEDGKVSLPLPPGTRVEVTVKEIAPAAATELTPEEEAALDAELEELLKPENLRGLGLTAAEIAQSPEIGIWKDREDMKDPVAWVAEMRRKSRERRLKRD